MTSTDHQKQAPLRLLDDSVCGRLGPGDLGVITARAGVGKSALLVNIALAQLLQERPVLHVALDQQVAEVRAWYDRMVTEAARHGLLEATDAQRMELERRRHIHSYLRQGFTAEKLSEALAFLADVMDFHPHTVLIDGFPFELASTEVVDELRDLARSSETSIWLTALTHRHEPIDPEVGLPKPVDRFAELLRLVVRLVPEGNRVLLRLLQDQGGPGSEQLPIRLDPATMLLAAD
ncbi:MAG: AAA family ATPase [bacterium]